MSDEWPRFNASFLVGIGRIDGQHRRLFEIAHTVYAHLGTAQAADQAAIAVTRELLDYTATHFVDEEALMRAAGYPGLEAHRREHAQLLSKVRDMALRAQADEPELPAELARFLLNWLVGHIQASDKKFGEFAAAQQHAAE